jgi:hypothetical protein
MTMRDDHAQTRINALQARVDRLERFLAINSPSWHNPDGEVTESVLDNETLRGEVRSIIHQDLHVSTGISILHVEGQDGD